MTNNDILARNALLLNILNELEPHLKREKIEIILLKGAALLELGVFALDEREMSDLDLLLAKKDSESFAGILKSLGFLEMPESSSAWYKTIKEGLPPLVVDLHISLKHIKNAGELWSEKIKIRENVFAMSLEELLIFAAVHPVLHHGFFDERAARDLRKILEKVPDRTGLLEKAMKKAGERGVSRLLAAAVNVSAPGRAEALKTKNSAKELFLSPFIKLAFRKHFAFNEYLLPFLYRPSSGFRLLFPDREFMRRRHGSAGLKSRLKRILGILLRIAGKGRG